MTAFHVVLGRDAFVLLDVCAPRAHAHGGVCVRALPSLAGRLASASGRRARKESGFGHHAPRLPTPFSVDRPAAERLGSCRHRLEGRVP